MIGQITHGSNFKELFRYLLSPDKGARIIGGNVFGETPSQLSQEFNNCAIQRPRTKKPVKHFIISLAPEDGVVSDQVKADIARKAIEELGYTNNQYVVIDHNRNDPGHDWNHNHDHIHVAVNMITLDGERVDDWQDKRRFEASLRNLEIEQNLTRVAPSSERIRKAPSAGQVQRYKRKEKLYKEGKLSQQPQPIIRTRLQKLIEAASQNKPTMIEFVARLSNLGVSVQTKITRNNVVQGISYSLDGVSFRGYRLHNSSFPKLQKIREIDFDPQRDLAALSAFNSEGGEGRNFASTSVNATTSLDAYLSSVGTTTEKDSEVSSLAPNNSKNYPRSAVGTTVNTLPPRNSPSSVVDNQFLKGLNTSHQSLFSSSSLGSELLELGIKRYNLYDDKQKKPIKPLAWLVEGETYSIVYDQDQLEFAISHRDRGEILKARSNRNKTELIVNSVEISDLKFFRYYLRKQRERQKTREKEHLRKNDALER